MEIIINRYFPTLKNETYNLIWLSVFCFIWLYSSANIASGSLVGVDQDSVQNTANTIILVLVFIPTALLLSFYADGLLGIWIGACIGQMLRLVTITIFLCKSTAYESKMIATVEVKEAVETKTALLNVFNMQVSYDSE